MTRPISPAIPQSFSPSNPQENPSPISSLPGELIRGIFTELGVSNALIGSNVCHFWNTVLNDNSLWKFFLRRDLRCDFQSLATEGTPKEVYRQEYLFNLNLPKGRYSQKEFDVGSDQSHSCAHIKGQELFLGLDGNKIEIWDLKSRTRKKTLIDVHGKIASQTGNIVHIVPTNTGKLISGSGSSSEIAVWDLETNACIMTIPGSPYSIFLNDGKLISHSCGGDIKIWNLENGVCEKTIERNEPKTTLHALLSKDGKKIIYGQPFDREIQVWNLESGICETTFQGNREIISLALTEEGKLISGECRGVDLFAGGEIRIWDLETGKCENTFQGHQGSVNSLVLTKNGKLISGCMSGEIKIWNLKNGDCEMTFKIDREQTKAFTPAMFSLALTEESELVARFESIQSGFVKIKVLNFNSSKIAIFRELAEIFDRGQHVPGAFARLGSAFNVATERFSRMPAEDRGKIYGELYEILKPFSNDYYGCGEHAFHDEHGQCSTPQQKAQAIKNYLEKM
ncbi:MAG: hypothetical protein WA347_05650 [Rhabdochlamydiaceae bacterium]|jgi:WD40 repeat protein